MKFIKLTALFIILFSSGAFQGQITTITFGTGSGTNSSSTYPAPYGNWNDGAKNQMLIRSSEMIAQGMSAGDISSIAFNVATAEGTALDDFTIGIMHTSNTDVSNGLETGFTTVFTGTSYTETAGWNKHTFSTPFYWDGTSNILIETCFNNPANSYTSNAIMYFSSTSFESTVVYKRDARTGFCSSNPPKWALDEYTERPDIQLEWEIPSTPPTADFYSKHNYNMFWKCSIL